MAFSRWIRLLAILAAVVALVSCGGRVDSFINPSPAPTPTPTPIVTGSIPQVHHVAVVVLENADYADVAGNASLPFLNGLLNRGSLVAKYYADAHPSIPNYFTMTTGMVETFNDSFSGVVADDNVVRDLAAAGKTWRAYAESLPSAGYLGGNQGLYLRRHNPVTYFSDVQNSATQAANVVPFSQLHSDMTAGALPNYSFIVPNAVNDAHSCADGSTTNCTHAQRLQAADAWLQTNITPLLNDPAFQSSGLLVIVFDESDDDLTNGGGHVFAAVVGTHVKVGYTGNMNTYDHRSLLSLTMHALGLSSSPNGADAAAQMTEFFQ